MTSNVCDGCVSAGRSAAGWQAAINRATQSKHHLVFMHFSSRGVARNHTGIRYSSSAVMPPSSLLAHLSRPLNPAPLTLIAVFAVLLTLGLRAGWLGVPLLLIVLSWFLKYGFVVLDTAARGLAEPPVLSVEMINPLDEQRPLGLLLIVGVFYGATAALEPIVGDTAVLLLRGLALALLPACTAVLGSSGSIVTAVNPRVLIGTIRRLDWDYVVIWLAIIVLAFTARLTGTRLLDATLGLPLAIACLMYGWFAVFSVIGGALYERRHELGIEAWRSPERDRARHDAALGKEHDRFIDELYGHWRGGAYKEALQAAQNRLAAKNHSLEEYAWLCQSLLRWPDRRLASRLAQDYLTRLLAARRYSQALTLAQHHLEADPEYRPATGAEAVQLANLARDGGDRRLARALLVDFERHYPADRAAPMAAQLSRDLSRSA